MADWNSGPTLVESWNQDGDVKPKFDTDDAANDATGWNDSNAGAKSDAPENGFEEANQVSYTGNDEDADKCFSCGETGHRKMDCPNAEAMTCRYCHQPGHMVKDCPDKLPMVCENCGEDGHMRKNCANARKINRDHINDVSAEESWDKLKAAVSERDVDDVKEALQEYVKATGGEVTYRELQEAFIADGINLWLIASERSLINVFSNMDLQGNMGKKYTVSYRFSEQPQRPRERDGWPSSREELLSRLDDAGDVVDGGIPKCLNCKELGHISKFCPQDKMERSDPRNTTCYNCGMDGHRVRDCPQPRVDKFACKNCGKSGHKVADCEEPPNLDNVECRKCGENGHFAKDCPRGGSGSNACRNCGQEGHFASDCDQPRNMDNVVCRNCDQSGHFSRDCAQPRDWSKVQCNNCQEFGHTKVRCPQPPKDDGGFDGGHDSNDLHAETSGNHQDAGWGTENAFAASADGQGIAASYDDAGGW